MSAPEAVAAPVATVEETKPADAVPPPEPTVSATEAPKPEEVAQSSVRLVFVSQFCSFLTPM